MIWALISLLYFPRFLYCGIRDLSAKISQLKIIVTLAHFWLLLLFCFQNLSIYNLNMLFKRQCRSQYVFLQLSA